MRIDAAVYTLNIVIPDGISSLITKLQAHFDDPDAPRIEIDHRPAALRFVCQTWRPILITRVNDALDAEIGQAERERRFRPF